MPYLSEKRPSQEFQSTPSAWRETDSYPYLDVSMYISIHSLRMEGDNIEYQHQHVNIISIHSLRMEGDTETE